MDINNKWIKFSYLIKKFTIIIVTGQFRNGRLKYQLRSNKGGSYGFIDAKSYLILL